MAQTAHLETWIVEKPSDQSLSSNTTLTNDNNMAVTLAANEVWHFRWNVAFNEAGVNAGYAFSVGGPSAPTNVRFNFTVWNGNTGLAIDGNSITAFGTSVNLALANTGDHILLVEGTVENGSNAGSVVLQFAQKVSDSGAITIKRGSSLVATRIS